ncbi:IPTL-CTERM sorting domain-containing protein [Pseudorhodoferax sp.]|uniref:IPTL-CTERM sorting domain-containing protein n=1 Tax=Pseudorhodoferax sp. TaxID=1993553 RepID=UPI002DD676B5|nr:IPTL-CTERM sorting domain-containing protein [Pseudorhodoferax sp.]
MQSAFRHLLAAASLCAVLPAGAVNLVTNGTFVGLTGWTTSLSTTGNASGICGYNADTTPGTETLTGTSGFTPASTPTTLALGAASVTATGFYNCVLYQDIAIPGGATTATITLDAGAKVTGAQSATNRVTDIGIYSTATVPRFLDSPLTGTATRIRLAAENGTSLVPRATTPATFNVSALAGTTVRFAIINAVQSTSGGSGAPPVNGESVTGVTNIVFDVTVVTPPPTVSADSYTTTANTPLSVAAPGVLANDVTSGGAMTAALATPPTNGTITLNADGSFLYTPNSGYTGADSFTYTASSGGSPSAPATATVTVTPAVPPTANADSYTTVAGSALTVVAPGLLANDSVGGGTTMTAAIASGPANGTANVAADGSFTYTPNSGFSGSDTFTYTATANGASSTPATVSLTVNAMVPTAIPTLSEWGLILTSALIGVLGFVSLRRHGARS